MTVSFSFDFRAIVPQTYDLVLCRSKSDPCHWSLYAAGVTAAQILEGGAAFPLLTGTARLDGGEWDRPTQTDYTMAAELQRKRTVRLNDPRHVMRQPHARGPP
jgi:hypothetical protein